MKNSGLVLSITILLVSTSPIPVRAQLASCAFPGTEIEKCLTQQEGHISLKPCCAVLNQAIQIGFYCLCSLISSSNNNPHINILLSGSFASGCEISIPPLTLCQVLAPTPTEPEDELTQVSPFTPPSKDLVLVQPPPPPPPPSSQELYVPFRDSSNCKYTAVGRQLPCVENEDTSSLNWAWSRAYYMPYSEGNMAKTLPSLTWLICSVVCAELLL